MSRPDATIETINHPFMVRRDFLTHIRLPADVTFREMSRLSRWASLYMYPDVHGNDIEGEAQPAAADPDFYATFADHEIALVGDCAGDGP